MNTHAHPFQQIELTSMQLQAAPDLTASLAFLVEMTDPDASTIDTLGKLLAQLDRHLDDDPIAGLRHFLQDADNAHGMADRAAAIQLLTHAGAEGLTCVPDTSAFASPPSKRRLTAVEATWARVVAIESGPRTVLTLAAYESGGSQYELANLEPEDLTIEGDRASLDVRGDRDREPRRLDLPSWALPHLHDLDRSGPWLLHNSRSDIADKRGSTLGMAVNKLLRQAGLVWPKTVTPVSIGRTSLARIANDGIDGWARAVAAAGHHNPVVTDRLLRLVEPW